MSHVVSRRDGLIFDLMKMISKGSSNDVKIVLKDGEIFANKDILTARCAFFATCFSNTEVKFKEGETNSVTFDHCNKNVMEKIINYLFTGDMKLYDFSLTDLLNMMNMTKMMMIDNLFDDIRKFVLNYITDSGVNYSSLPELVEGLMLAEQFKLEATKDALVLELFRSLKDIPHIPDVVENSDAFTSLPANLLKDILLHREKIIAIVGVTPTTKQRFDAFVFWLEKNQCDENERTEIARSFCLSDFNGQELLTDVRRSGLFSIKEIDSKVLEILNSCQQNLVKREAELTAKNDALSKKQKVISSKDAIIKRTNTELCSKKTSLNTWKEICELKEQTIKSMEGTIKRNEDKMKKCRKCQY